MTLKTKKYSDYGLFFEIHSLSSLFLSFPLYFLSPYTLCIWRHVDCALILCFRLVLSMEGILQSMNSKAFRSFMGISPPDIAWIAFKILGTLKERLTLLD